MDYTVEKYLEKKALFANFNVYKNYDFVSQKDSQVEIIAIVIPVYMEYPYFYKTLLSLQDSLEYVKNPCVFRVICVVNNKKDDSSEIKDNSQKTVKMLRNQDKVYFLDDKLYIDILDCCTEGFEIPSNQGVGYCRKIGMDYALKIGAKVLVCLDGDTLVSKNYCSVLLDFASKKNPYAALIPFKHQTAESLDQRNGIQLYESFMKKHSSKLKKTGTIYYQTALGPTIVCSVKAYIAVGGMNQKLAGEDFYFFQALVKNKGTPLEVLDSMVYPSARISYRVPFGTGQVISSICGKTLNSKEQLYKDGYPNLAYKIIFEFIQYIKQCCKKKLSSGELKPILEKKLPEIQLFLQDEEFYILWEKLLVNNKKSENLERAFHCWFDGLKIIRLIHFVEESLNPES
ncbi:MAG: glycosyltransferase [Spirochaetaceae bacterium]|nr:glycosyltransferase [Spirochaetaceae bacterium]